MGAIIIGIGVAIAAIGVVLCVNGLAIYQSTFGNALVILGGIGFVGGLTIIALGFIHRALVQIADRLDGVMHFEPEEEHVQPAQPAEAIIAPPTVPVRHREPVAPPVAEPVQEVAPPPPPAAPRPRAPEPAYREATDRQPAPREPAHREPAHREPAHREAAVYQPPARPPVPEPEAEPVAEEPEALSSGLPSWFRRTRAPVVPQEPQVDYDEPVPTRAEPARVEDWSEPWEEPEPVPEPEPLPMLPRREPAYGAAQRQEPSLRPEPSMKPEPALPVLPVPPRRLDPAAEYAAFEPRYEPAQPHDEPERDAAAGEPGAPPAFLRHTEAAEDQNEEDDAPAARAAAVTVLKSGTIGGMAYTLYSDGSIEAELPDGPIRFASLQQLRDHVAEAASQPAAAERE